MPPFLRPLGQANVTAFLHLLPYASNYVMCLILTTHVLPAVRPTLPCNSWWNTTPNVMPLAVQSFATLRLLTSGNMSLRLSVFYRRYKHLGEKRANLQRPGSVSIVHIRTTLRLCVGTKVLWVLLACVVGVINMC